MAGASEGPRDSRRAPADPGPDAPDGPVSPDAPDATGEPGSHGRTSRPGVGGRRAIFDPFSGVSGDMVLGCWLELGRKEGLEREWLLDVADRLRLSLEDVRVETVSRAGLTATKVTVVPEGGRPELPPDLVDGERGDEPEPHDGSPEAGRGAPKSRNSRGAVPSADHHGRAYARIRSTIEDSALPDRSRSLALAAFARLAEAEARVHGVPPEQVHFHEVGAVDAILDICAAADGWVRLGIEDGRTHPVAVGTAWVEMAHGRYPVPAPATAYLLEGTAVRATGYPYELVTPTGAALLAQFTGGRFPSEDATILRVGYGAGTRDPRGHSNCLRVWLAEVRDAPGAVLVLQADVDDMTPEYVPDLLDACLEAGALDAVVIGTQMKKGRAGWRLEVQVEPRHRDAVEEAVLRHSTTLGLRSWPVSRRVLARATEERKWRGHRIRVKLRDSAVEGGAPRAKPEHDDVAAAAAAEGLPASELLRRLRREWPDLE